MIGLGKGGGVGGCAGSGEMVWVGGERIKTESGRGWISKMRMRLLELDDS